MAALITGAAQNIVCCGPAAVSRAYTGLHKTRRLVAILRGGAEAMSTYASKAPRRSRDC